jgi:hypothetical protein
MFLLMVIITGFSTSLLVDIYKDITLSKVGTKWGNCILNNNI